MESTNIGEESTKTALGWHNMASIETTLSRPGRIVANFKAKCRIAVQSFHREVGVVFVFVFLLLLVVGISMQSIDGSFFLKNDIKPPPLQPINLTCPSNKTVKSICSATPSSSPPSSPLYPSPSCPEYFRYIYEDLRPWIATGITRATAKKAQKLASFRVVVVDGRAYVERYKSCFQTRKMFTLWGIVQLLNRYPGRLPDVELMFSCDDETVVKSADYPSSSPPPVFHYCKDETTLDILFPDWSFWGWVEVNVKPWELSLKELKEGNERIKWRDREPYAYWKGNPLVALIRKALFKCNLNNNNGSDWNARLFKQDWEVETRNGFKESNLADQCVYRYKIYVEGISWSVSQKYILACNSPTLLVTTPFQEFWARGLMPGRHYWPINRDHICKSINFAVDWGNAHQEEAQEIGRKGSSFLQKEVSMNYVYDYMLHLLKEYAKLLKYKPTIPEKATELCLESMACQANSLRKSFMVDSMVRFVSDSEPCAMPPPFDPKELEEISQQKDKFIKQVEIWEQL
ncbi:uncharacterized protein [Typha latifolia]|uniref:uncharacterized protein n=1 Tax=Typha latifolia TaxID=4733 RepID=UPI003C2AB804